MRTRVQVRGVPTWVDTARLLDSGPWQAEGEAWVGERSPAEAADLGARLRGVVFAGAPVSLTADPPPGRALVRAARAEEARRLRVGSPGFSRPGARVDAPGRVYLTPEKLALALGRRAQGAAVVDACCGCGGNAIGFARAGCQVTAIELDADRLALAQHNARVYGVEDRIRFVRADARHVLPGLQGELLFLDPPWGDDPAQIPLLDALIAAGEGFERVWAKLPPAWPGLPAARREAWFGHAEGDRQRVKFALVEVR